MQKFTFALIGNESPFINFLYVNDDVSSITLTIENYKFALGKTFNSSGNQSIILTGFLIFLSQKLSVKGLKKPILLLVKLFVGVYNINVFLLSFNYCSNQSKELMNRKSEVPCYQEGFGKVSEELKNEV